MVACFILSQSYRRLSYRSLHHLSNCMYFHSMHSRKPKTAPSSSKFRCICFIAFVSLQLPRSEASWKRTFSLLAAILSTNSSFKLLCRSRKENCILYIFWVSYNAIRDSPWFKKLQVLLSDVSAFVTS
jgi:hypothetical protein